MNIFIGGYPGSGTRVISMLLEKKFNIGEVNDSYDYMPILEDIADIIDGKKKEYNFKEKEPFALKHGQLMLTIPQIKKLYPESKFILVVRNGADNIENGFRWHETFLKGSKGDHPDERMNAWVRGYEIALKDADYLIRLEDIVDNPEKELTKLFDYLGLKDPDTSIIKRPATIGQGKDREYAEAKIKHWMREFTPK